jgi:hypothetical protein
MFRINKNHVNPVNPVKNSRRRRLCSGNRERKISEVLEGRPAMIVDNQGEPILGVYITQDRSIYVKFCCYVNRSMSHRPLR